MIKIKDTKSVKIHYWEERDSLIIVVDNQVNELVLPMKKIFQVQRGITSAIQRFYRYESKSNTKKS